LSICLLRLLSDFSSGTDVSATAGSFKGRGLSNSKDISSVGILAIPETPSSSKYASTTVGTFRRREFSNIRDINSVGTLTIAETPAAASTQHNSRHLEKQGSQQ
jgi:hypothetical protein